MKQRLLDDLSQLEVEKKDMISPEEVIGEEPVPRATDLQLRVFSEDLEGLTVETDIGLLIGLNPAPKGSFFNPTLDDDTSYKLLCPACLHRYWPIYGQGRPFTCPACAQESKHFLAGVTFPLWYCAASHRLAVEKLEKRDERLGGPPRGATAEDLDEWLKSQSFVATLTSWVEEFADPLESNLIAWDLADRLGILWEAWKRARRPRRPGKRLSAFRALGEAFDGEEALSWTRYPDRLTGRSVPVKESKPAEAPQGESP